MYAYLVALHQASEVTACNNTILGNDSASSLLPGSLSTLVQPAKKAVAAAAGPEEVRGFQIFWLEQVIEPATLAAALTEYYTQMFQRLRFMDGDNFMGDPWVPNPFTVTADRIEIPSGFTPQQVEKDIFAMNIKNLSPLKLVFDNVQKLIPDPDNHNNFISSPPMRVNSALVVPPSYLKTQQQMKLFKERLSAWATAETLKEKWVNTVTESQAMNTMGVLDGPGCSYASAFDGAGHHPKPAPAATKAPTPTAATTAYVFDIPGCERQTSGKSISAAELRTWSRDVAQGWVRDTTPLKFDRVILPCSFTPFLGTPFCPEVDVQKIEVGAVPILSAATPILRADIFENFEKARAKATLAAVSRYSVSELDAKAVVTPPSQLPSGPTGAATPVSAQLPVNSKLAKYPHAQQLNALWTIFTQEYVQRKFITESDEFADHALPSGPDREELLGEVASIWQFATPLKLFLTAWKLFALRPKASGLSTIPHFADTPVGTQPLPVNWEKDITPELLMEWFYELKTDVAAQPNSGGIKVSFLSPMLTQKLRILCEILYKKKVPANFAGFTAEAYSELYSLDYNPIVEILLGQPLSEASKNALVAAFIRDELQYPTEGAVVGSAELHAHFQEWLIRTFVRIGFKPEEHQILNSQFGITEFSRLMKAAGFETTRRARGMVYLNTAINDTSKSGSSKTSAGTNLEDLEGFDSTAYGVAAAVGAAV